MERDSFHIFAIFPYMLCNERRFIYPRTPPPPSPLSRPQVQPLRKPFKGKLKPKRVLAKQANLVALVLIVVTTHAENRSTTRVHENVSCM